jgi:uncharacterized secreted protein with C-terminal beta-propeller domain
MSRQDALAIAVVTLVIGAGVGGLVTGAAIGPAAPGTAGGPAADEPGGADGSGPGSTADADDPPPSAGAGTGEDGGGEGLVRFSNRTAFQEYVRAGAGERPATRVGVRRLDGPQATPEAAMSDGSDGADAGGDGAASGDAARTTAPDRIGTTNVQVGGLDEPDLVKAGEGAFYYAPRGRTARPVQEPEPRTDTASSPVPRRPGGTHVVDVGEPASPERIAEIDASGRLLRSGDTLVVLERDRLVAYDVSDPANPEEAWSRGLNASLVTARQRGDTIYLVTRSGADPRDPCPIRPLGPATTVECDDVHRPTGQVQVDATYTVLSLDAPSGEVRDTASVVGTARNTVVYASSDAVYLTYTAFEPRGELLTEYALDADVPDHVAERIREIRTYDISAQSTEREIRRALANWWESLPESEADERRQAFHEGFRDYLAERQRELARTGVVRVSTDGTDLAVDGAGEVPGHPLNQFSLSQHNGTLRLATTVPAVANAQSENDLYVLDAETLEAEGSVTGMGLNERVYAVRYVGDTAYVVTFRRIDPFHVVDLSDPSNPTVEGELKLPGFSSYLHPVDDDHVVGIGEENGRVKTVLFDVSDPSNPTVADDMVLEEGWSAVAESHHAFTIDRRHGVFFLPAGDEGLVVNYTEGRLSVETSIRTQGAAQRARYVDDYLYVFGEAGIDVLDERDWSHEASLDLST